MILLVSQHLGEIEPLLKFYPFVKQGKYLICDNLSVYINRGADALNLAFNTVKAIEELNCNLALLFGYAGAVSGVLRVGEFYVYRMVKLLDSNKPLFNPVDLREIEGFDSIDGVTLIDGYYLDNDYLSLFGDAVDKESYFFAKAVKSTNAHPFVLRVISDKNTRKELIEVRKGFFGYDAGRLKALVDRLMGIERDPTLFEIFLHTSILDRRKLSSICGVIKKKHYTFSERQKLYRSIVLRRHRAKSPEGDFKKVYFVEKGTDIQVGKGKVVSIDDYTRYFHNLKDERAVIFARKRGEFLRKTPSRYTPDGYYGYSILNAYNCLYACSYCFLRCYFRSFNPVIFVNYDNFFCSILEKVRSEMHRPLYFYLGTFADNVVLSSLYDTYTPFVRFFSSLPDDVILEIRTKSDRVEDFLELSPPKNVIIAFSLAPQSAIDRYERRTPSLKRRLSAIKLLKSHSFNVGIRFDPLFVEFLDEYDVLLNELDRLGEFGPIEIGFLRYDKNCYSKMLKKGYAPPGMVFEDGLYRIDRAMRDKAIEFFNRKGVSFYLNME